MEFSVRREWSRHAGPVDMWRYVQFQRRFDMRCSEYWRAILLAGCMPLLAVFLLLVATVVYRTKKPSLSEGFTINQMRWFAFLSTTLIFLALCCELLLHYNLLRSFPKLTFVEDDSLTNFRRGVLQKIQEATKDINPYKVHPVDEITTEVKLQNPNSIDDLYALYKRLTLRLFSAAGRVGEQLVADTPRYLPLKHRQVLLEWMRYLVMTTVWSVALGLAAVTTRGGGAADAACGACGLMFCAVMAAVLTCFAAALADSCENESVKSLEHQVKKRDDPDDDDDYLEIQHKYFCRHWGYEIMRRLAEFRWRMHEANRKWVTQAFIDGLLVKTNTYKANETWPLSLFSNGYYGRRLYTIEIYEKVLQNDSESIQWLSPKLECKSIKPRLLEDKGRFVDCHHFLRWILLQLVLVILAIFPFLVLLYDRPTGRRPSWRCSGTPLKCSFAGIMFWPVTKGRKMWAAYKEHRRLKAAIKDELSRVCPGEDTEVTADGQIIRKDGTPPVCCTFKPPLPECLADTTDRNNPVCQHTSEPSCQIEKQPDPCQQDSEPETSCRDEPEPTCQPICEPEPTCQPICEPEPTCQPICTPEPTCQPICKPEPNCQPICEPAPICQSVCEPEPCCPAVCETVSSCQDIYEPEPTCRQDYKPVTKCQSVSSCHISPTPSCLKTEVIDDSYFRSKERGPWFVLCKGPTLRTIRGKRKRLFEFSSSAEPPSSSPSDSASTSKQARK